jgi:hypothetical protein
MLRRPLGALALLVALATAAHAAPSARALAEMNRRVGRANQLYTEGAYEQALRLYLAAYELVAAPDILYNIALAREKLLDHEGCALAFRQYLEAIAEGDPQREPATAGFARCRERATIRVPISSIPAGAQITLLDEGASAFRGRTPRVLELTPGRYQVSVELPGYLPMKQEVEVEVGARPEIDFPLERLSTLAIEVDVAGAAISIDGGAAEPAPLRREVPAGLYKVRVTKAGHEPAERELRVAPGEQSTLLMSLRPVAARRRLSIRSDVPATVSLDGRRLGRTPLTALAPVSAARLEVGAPGRVPFVEDLSRDDERDLRLEVDLATRRTPPERAFLWSLAGGAAAAALGAAVSGGLAKATENDFEQHPSVALAERGEAHAERADLLWGVSLGLAVTAAITWYATDRESRARRR